VTALADVRPVRRFYLGLTANPYDALSTVVWTEIPNTKVKTATLQWGAQHELARVEPSYVAVTLDNVGGDFETQNPASPYYPNLRPLNRLRIIDTWAGVDYIRFTGYVVDWPRSWTGINRAVVQIEAYDALGAVLNGVDVPASPWEMEVRNIIEAVPVAGKAVWLRLNETSGTVAADASGYGLDGQYQGSPTLGVAGLTPDGDKAFQPIAGTRASLPYKNLITQFPWSVAVLLRTAADRAAQKVILYATDGPSTSPLEYLQIFVESNSGITPPGSLVAALRTPSGQRRIYSSVVVDTGLVVRVAVVFTSATNAKIYVDNVDVTLVHTAGAPSVPQDLNTGFAVGNTPAVTFGDFRFATTIPTDVLDEVLFLDGVALTTSQISRLNTAAVATPSAVSKSGQRLLSFLTALGWPSADTAIDTGLTTVQQGYVAGSALAYMNRLDVTEGGRLFINGSGQIVFHDRHKILQSPYTVSQATFGEDHAAGEIGYVGPFNHGEDDTEIRNDVHRGNVGGVVQVRRDKASKDRYGWKTHAVTDMLGTSNEEARDRANRDLSIYKDPVTRFRQVIVKPQEDAAQGTAVWPKMLGLGQNSRVTVKAQPPGASMITQASHVERMEETVTPDDWQIVLGLSAAQTGEFWRLDASALGTGTRLSY
jgi:hypothetical protein